MKIKLIGAKVKKKKKKFVNCEVKSFGDLECTPMCEQ